MLTKLSMLLKKKEEKKKKIATICYNVCKMRKQAAEISDSGFIFKIKRQEESICSFKDNAARLLCIIVMACP